MPKLFSRPAPRSSELPPWLFSRRRLQTHDYSMNKLIQLVVSALMADGLEATKRRIQENLMTFYLEGP